MVGNILANVQKCRAKQSREYTGGKGRCRCKALARKPKNKHRCELGVIRWCTEKNAEKCMRGVYDHTCASRPKRTVPREIKARRVLRSVWRLDIKNRSGERSKLYSGAMSFRRA